MSFAPRTYAKTNNISLHILMEILKRQRPDQSKMEAEFCRDFIEHLEGINEDAFGNYWLQIGDDTTTLWSCHTDTVAKVGGFQNITWEGNILKLHNGKPGQCLGADDGAGLWLMLEMIKANKPGLYVFHRAEEVGGRGSDWIANKNPALLTGMKRAIAFDRKGTTSVITKQRWQRCCSDEFGQELANRLNQHGLAYKLDPTGVFTDTANYDHLIPECTNLSVGYYNEHGPRETLDVAHLLKLREALLAVDFESLPTSRDPKEVEYDNDDYYGYTFGRNHYLTQDETVLDIVRARPIALARYLEAQGVTAEALEIALDDFATTGKAALAWEAEEPNLWCNECVDTFYMKDAHWGDPCPICLCRDTEVYDPNA